MNKHEIPFIFKYLLKWVPGLKIGDEGNTPIPPIEEYLFEEGQPFYTVFFNRGLENPDFTSLDWSEAIDVTLDSLSVSVLKLLSMTHTAYSKPINFDVWVQKIPAGTQLGPSLFLDRDAYFLCGGKLDEIISGESTKDPLMIYVDPHYYDLISIYEPTFGPGWIEEEKDLAELTYLGVLGVKYEVNVGNEPICITTYVNAEQDKWKAFMSPLPFERGEIQEDDLAPAIFYNPDIVPDLTQIDWTDSSHVMSLEEHVKIAQFIYDASYFGVFAVQFTKGDISFDGSSTYHLDEDAYGIYLGWPININDPIYADENYIKLLKALIATFSGGDPERIAIVENMVPGWDPVGRGNHFDGYAFIGGVGNNEMCKMKKQNIVAKVLQERKSFKVAGVEFQDIWKDYISNKPFNYNKIED